MSNTDLKKRNAKDPGMNRKRHFIGILPALVAFTLSLSACRVTIYHSANEQALSAEEPNPSPSQTISPSPSPSPSESPSPSPSPSPSASASPTATPTPTLSLAGNVSVGENAGQALFTAQLSLATAQDVTFSWSTADGTATAGSDYTAVSASATIPAGQTSVSLSVPILDDTLDENDENFTVSLSNPTNAVLSGSNATATGTIQDNDPAPSISFTAASSSAAESAGTKTITVQLSAASAKSISVPFSVSASSTAAAPADYSISTLSPLTFTPGQTSKTITVSIVDDTASESDETVILDLATPTNATLGATSSHTLTIQDNDVSTPTLSVSDLTVPEYGVASVLATLSGTSATDVTFKYSTLNGTATAGSGFSVVSNRSVTIPAGTTQVRLPVSILDDFIAQSGQFFQVQISGVSSNATINQNTATVSITDNDPPSTSMPSLSSLGTGALCAITASGALKCWGMNDNGRVGDSSNSNYRSLATDVSGLTSGVTQVSTGYYHSCAIASGVLKCWGANAYGELGNNSTTDSTTPVTVDSSLGAGVSKIAVGYYHSCAIVSGAIKCWGKNSQGQVGDGTVTSPRKVPTAVTGLGGLTTLEIVSGSDHSCARFDDGSVRCWGAGGSGRLGNNATSNSSSPVSVSGLGTVVQLAAGDAHTCALIQGGTVKCWGRNTNGQIGDNSRSNRKTPVAVSGLGGTVTQIAAGWENTCALLSDGSVQCWGANDITQGFVGDGTSTPRLTPSTVQGLPSSAVEISAATVGGSMCARLDTGAVMCWGLNDNGKLGVGIVTDQLTVDQTTPRDVVRLTGAVTSISSAYSHSCAVTSDGAVKCWGENYLGEMGNGLNDGLPQTVPQTVTGISSGATQVTTGEGFACAVVSGGVKCWGDNWAGQLGDGSTNSFLTPVTVKDSAGTGTLSGVTDLAAGYWHTCAIVGSSVKCWGANDFGELGDGSWNYASLPVTVTGLGITPVKVSAGDEFTCALGSNGRIQCWGSNYAGQLGDGTTTTTNQPVYVQGITNAIDIVVGDEHTCAVTSGGALYCWGENVKGQLGDGTTTNSITPKLVNFATGEKVKSVFASKYWANSPGNHSMTCAVLDSGALKCWGENNHGKLGDGTSTSRSTPVQVQGLESGVVAATGGTDFTCALMQSGDVKCWGANSSYYQLGIFDFTLPHLVRAQ